MADKNNAIEFTEVRYASRKEMSNTLGIAVPEDMWNKVEKYREPFNVSFSLKDTENRNLFLCLYPTFSAKLSSLENKVARVKDQFDSLNEERGDKDAFKFAVYFNELKALAEKHGINIEDARLKKMLASENPFDDGEERLIDYYYGLKFIEENRRKSINVDYLADLYSVVTGIPELTYFYRNTDFNDIDSIALVSRVYKSAPADRIEMMMDNLFSFITDAEVSPLIKAFAAHYFVSYVKPFKDHNDEIAILIAKAVLAHYDLPTVATLLPLENLLNQRPDVLRKMNQDVVTTADLTYFVAPNVSRVERELDEILDLLADYSARNIRNEFYEADVEVKPAPAPVVEEVPFMEPEPTPAPAPFIEEPEPVVEEVIVEEASAPQELAINFVPTKIDEKEAQRIEEHLLEMDYRLKKGEAKFYARHCTVGMYYTIEQYRKAIKCVYETARTSMDHLAELGYYNKQQAGKKFVYTPVKRK